MNRAGGVAGEEAALSEHDATIVRRVETKPEGHFMDVQFIASIAVIAPDPSVSRRVLRGCACMTIRQRRYLLLYSTVEQCISRSPALSRRSVDHRMIDHALLNTPHGGDGAVFTGLHQMLERLTQRLR